MKKKIFLRIAGVVFLISLIGVGLAYFVGSNPERFQGVGGKPASMVYMDDKVYVYDLGSGEVYSGCWCPLAGTVLTKPVIWIVDPETKSLESTILESDTRFVNAEERIRVVAQEHLAGYTKSQFGGNGFTPVYVHPFDDGKNIYYGISGWLDSGFDSEFQSFARVLEKETRAFRQPTDNEEYAILSLAYWFDDEWIIAARTDGDGSETNPVGNAQLRITDRKTGLSTDITLDVSKNIASRLAFGILNLSVGILFLVLFGGVGSSIFLVLVLIFSVWWIRQKGKSAGSTIQNRF